LYGYLAYFVAIWYILWPLSIFYGHLVYFPPFWYVAPRKIWQPCSKETFFLLAGADSRRNSSSAHKAFDSQIFFLVKIPAQRISFQGGEQVAVEEERLHRGQLLQRRCRNLSAATRKYKRFKLMRPIPE
jgi:hypothetical protein